MSTLTDCALFVASVVGVMMLIGCLMVLGSIESHVANIEETLERVEIRLECGVPTERERHD